MKRTWSYPALRDLPVRRILVIKLRAIGDILLSTIVLRNLRHAFPDARIDMLVEPPAQDIVERHPALDGVVLFAAGKDSPLHVFRSLRRAHYDLVFDLFCNPRSAQFTFVSGAAVRVGYPFRGRSWAYNVHVTSRADRVHNTEFNLDALSAVGIPIIDRSVTIDVPKEDSAWAQEYTAELRQNNRMLVALNPSGTWESKRWPAEYFAALVDMLTERRNARVILLWGPGEEQTARSILAMTHSDAVVPPSTSLIRLAALLSACDAMITNDTGPMHIGAAVGIPVLGIFGPTNPLLQGPYNTRSTWVRREGLTCLGCNRTVCPIGKTCMTDLKPEVVFEAFAALLPESHGKGTPDA
ncbi:MAG: glycosyltransferase family 9 protein [Bacteroidota bacterium]|nr:glycosyltransferase family 9 protein [Bacteroidota bacterium]